LSVGPPFFDKTTGPIALLLALFMGVGPLLRWRRDQLGAALRRAAIPGIILIVALGTVLLLAPGIGILPLLGLVVAAGVAVASVAPLWKRDLKRTPLFTWGMVIAHFGIAVSLAGMASDSAFTKETLVAARIGETERVGPFTVRLDNVSPAAGANWSAMEADLDIRRGDGASFTMHPQSRFFATPPMVTSESAIATRLDGQLYTVLGQQDQDGRWQLRLWWKPFVTLIWFGGILVALGGTLSLIGRTRRKDRAIREQPVAG
jgi:cytochrome c-type biogenesis protein CcmF